MRLIYPSKLSRHTLFWAGVIVCLPSLEFISSKGLLADPTYATIYWINFFGESLPVYLLFTYSLLYGVIPLLLQKRYVLGAVIFLGLIVLSSLAQKVLSEVDLYVVQPLLLNFTLDDPFSWALLWDDLKNASDWAIYSFDFVLIGFVAAGIKLFGAWTAKQRENQRLEQQKLETDLQILKLKLNPAFLFDSLKTLYALTKQGSAQAPEVVLGLSHFLRYVLYESQADAVPLSRETEIIGYYVSLQQTMHPTGLDVSFTVRGNAAGRTIAPLSLFPVVAHAFRHLTSEPADESPTDDEPAWVSIDLAIGETHLTLKVIDGQPGRPDDEAWLVDVRKQLLFYYPDQFDLRVLPEPDAHIVSLNLPSYLPARAVALTALHESAGPSTG